MKSRRLSLVLVLLISALSLCAQSPAVLNYQGVARDESNEPYTNQLVGLRFTILNSLALAVYSETQSLTTNEFGLINTTIGGGHPASFQSVDWASDTYSLKVELDIGNDGSWEIDEVNALGSVPYALYGEDDDTDPANELQTLGISGNQLSISPGNTIDLPTGTASPWVTSGSIIYYNAGMVGIGTDTPGSRLSVKSNDLASVEGSKISWLNLAGNSGNWDILKVLHRRHTDGSDWNSSEVIIQKQVDTSPMHYISFKGMPANNAQLEFGFNSTPYMTIDRFGRVGIGTTNPTRTFEVAGGITINGNIIQNNDHQIWRNNKALHLRQDDNISWISNIGNFVGNGSETNGALCLVGENGIQLRYGYGTGGGDLGLYLTNAGRVGIGTTSPSGKVQVEGDSEWSDEEPLFKVVNKSGIPVFAVYNNGVRILVNDDPDDLKARSRGGFAVGGFDRDDKAGYQETFDFMRITPDSVRFNIDNSTTGKAPGSRGGFAVGGFDRDQKGEINEDFMYLTPKGSNEGLYNSFVGYQAGYRTILTGNYNSFFGYQAGYSNTEGDYNIYIGAGSGDQNVLGHDNVIVGANSGTTGTNFSYSTFVGAGSGLVNTGSENTFLGCWSGNQTTSGFRNTYIGTFTGFNNVGGDDNVFIGYKAGLNETGSERLYIDNSDTNEPLIYGYFGDDWVKINGQLRIRDVPYGDYQNLQWNASNGLIYQDNSSMRYKENISLLNEEFSNILNVAPKKYTRPGSPDRWELGYIAEEFEEAGLGKLVWYDNEGRPEGINYEKIVLYSNENIKTNRQRVEELEQEVADLQYQIMELSQIVSSLLQKQE